MSEESLERILDVVIIDDKISDLGVYGDILDLDYQFLFVDRGVRSFNNEGDPTDLMRKQLSESGVDLKRVKQYSDELPKSKVYLVSGLDGKSKKVIQAIKREYEDAEIFCMYSGSHISLAHRRDGALVVQKDRYNIGNAVKNAIERY